MVSSLAGLVAGVFGMTCLWVAYRRRRIERPETTTLLVLSGLALVFAGTVTLTP